MEVIPQWEQGRNRGGAEQLFLASQEAKAKWTKGLRGQERCSGQTLRAKRDMIWEDGGARGLAQDILDQRQDMAKMTLRFLIHSSVWLCRTRVADLLIRHPKRQEIRSSNQSKTLKFKSWEKSHDLFWIRDRATSLQTTRFHPLQAHKEDIFQPSHCSSVWDMGASKWGSRDKVSRTLDPMGPIKCTPSDLLLPYQTLSLEGFRLDLKKNFPPEFRDTAWVSKRDSL
jgi:hypothetical protein